MPRYPIQLTIPEPCAQDWNAMTPVAGGRHCDSCRKTVVDFTGMNNAAVRRFIAQTDGEICGRMRKEQLELPLDAARELSPRKSFLAAATAALAISISSTAHAWTSVEIRPSGSVENAVGASEAETRLIAGRVVDANGRPVPGARVTLEYADSEGILARRHTGSDGRFETGVPAYLGGNPLVIRIVAGDETMLVGPFQLSGATMLVEAKLQQEHVSELSSRTIRGLVYDERGNPVVNAYVELTESGIVKGREVSDFDGAFSINYNIDIAHVKPLALTFRYMGIDTVLEVISAPIDTIDLTQPIVLNTSTIAHTGVIVTGGLRSRPLTIKERIARRLRRIFP